MVNYEVLTEKLREAKYVGMTSEQILEDLRSKNIQITNPRPVMVRYRTLVDNKGIVFAERIIGALEAGASGDGPVAKAISRLLPTMLNDSIDSGIDIASNTVRSLIDNLTTGDNDYPILFEEEDADTLKSIGVTYTSWTEQNQCHDISLGTVDWALKIINDGVGY